MSTEIQVKENQDMSLGGMLFDFSMIEKMNDLAKLMATSKIAVPAHYRNSPGDCLAVVMQSMQWQMNPFAVAQKTFPINGILGYEAQLVSAVISSRAPIKHRLEYEWFGPWEKIVGKFKTVESSTKKDDNGKPKTYIVPDWNSRDEVGLGVRVWTTLKGEEKPRVLELLMTQARTRNSTLWAEDPKQQIAYLATKRWARLYCPDVILGVYTPDELEPQEVGEKQINPEVETKTKEDEVLSKLNKKPVADKTIYVDMETVLTAIEAINSKETQEAAKNLVAQLSPENIKNGKEAYKKRCAFLTEQALKAKEKVDSEDPDWIELIEQCKTIDEINELCEDMPQHILIDLYDKIEGAKFEIFETGV